LENTFHVSLDMSAPFHFKQFSIHQDSAPFKVGTDAVLLGSWAPVKQDGCYMDVGTGTGVLACMLAQRGAGKILAVEQDPTAAMVAKENFAKLPFDTQIELFTQGVEQLTYEEKVDGIICNPPYFLNHTPNPNQVKVAARHATVDLPEQWTRLWAHMVKEEGTMALVMPIQVFPAWETAFRAQNFHVKTRLWVKSTEEDQPIRVLAVWSRQAQGQVKEDSLFLYEKDKKTRSHGYAQLTKDFYL